MIDISSLAPGLRAAEPGLWVSDASTPVSFPEDAHAGCYTLEDDSFWFAHRNAILLEALRAFPPAGALFDVGGGNGYVTQTLIAAGFEAVLVEPGEVGVRNALRRGIAPIVQATLETARFAPGSLPAIGLFDVLEHVQDDSEFLASAGRVLRPGGRLYVAVPALEWLWSDADAGCGHFRRYRRSQLVTALERARFHVEYSTYFFSQLVLPVLFGRALPSWLRRTAPKLTLQQRAEREHRPHSAWVHALLRRATAFECARIRARRALPLGSSCLAVACARA